MGQGKGAARRRLTGLAGMGEGGASEVSFQGEAVLTCESAIQSVVVYARGAEVTRGVELPESMPEERVVLCVRGVTPLAQGGTLRALVEGEREVLSVSSRLAFSETGVVLSEVSERVRTLELERKQLRAFHGEIASRRESMLRQNLTLGMRGRRRHLEPLSRIQQGLAVSELLDAVVVDMERERQEVRRRLEELERELEALSLKQRQASASERLASGHPTRELMVELGPGPGAVGSLSLVYAVETARWWPTYSVRLSDAARKAELALEAFVVQTSLEDWSNVRLSLSTAERVTELALPELPSMRLGKAQPHRERGFREPPEGLDGLFASYDQAARRLGLESPPAPPEEPQTEFYELEEAPFEGEAILALDLDGAPGGFGGAPPMMSVQAQAAAPRRRDRAKKKSKGRSAKMVMKEEARVSFGAVADEESDWEGEAEEGYGEVDEAWLDYDSLVLEDPQQMGAGRRGKLTRGSQRSEHPVMREARTSFQRVEAPRLAQTPEAFRGIYDYRYDAEGQVKIPADGMLHRVQLRVRETSSTPRFRTVPMEDLAVYREVELVNPLGAPLLAGPLDVFVGGALVTTTSMDTVDTGGTLHFGLGVEDRLRVVRTPRFSDDTSSHLLGNKSHARHHITIELASSLGFACEVEVIDRVPITHDERLEVNEVEHTPRARAYTQRDRDAPVEGGLRWVVSLEPGGEQHIDLKYSIEMSVKYEVQGGNNRE